MARVDDRIVKVRVPEVRYEGFTKFPWNTLPLTPPQDCVFDSYRGTIGFDVFPFAVTTKISCASEVFLKIYEDTD